MQRAPQSSKSRVLRVTTVRPWHRLVAAIKLSMTGRGRPRRSDSPTSEPHRVATAKSTARIRVAKRSARSFRTHASDGDDAEEQGLFLAFLKPGQDRSVGLRLDQLGDNASVELTVSRSSRVAASAEVEIN